MLLLSRNCKRKCISLLRCVTFVLEYRPMYSRAIVSTHSGRIQRLAAQPSEFGLCELALCWKYEWRPRNSILCSIALYRRPITFDITCLLYLCFYKESIFEYINIFDFINHWFKKQICKNLFWLKIEFLT